MEIHRTKGLLSVFQKPNDDGGGSNTTTEKEDFDKVVNARNSNNSSSSKKTTTTTTTKQMMLQGVREVFEITDLPRSTADSRDEDPGAAGEEDDEKKQEDQSSGKIVFIGRLPSREIMEESLRWNVLQ